MTAEETTYLEGLADEIADRVADRIRPLLQSDSRPPRTVLETAKRLNISESGVRNLVNSGKLTTIRVGAGDGSVRIEESVIDAYLAEQRRQQRARSQAELREANDGS